MSTKAELRNADQSSSARTAKVLTADDNTTLSPVPNSLYIGTGGDVFIETVDGDEVPFYNMPDGSYLLCAVAKILETTTASNINGLYF